MTKKEMFLLALGGVVIAVLYLMSSTDLIIKEKVAVVHAVSVIVGDDTDEYYMNFRLGMDQAALEYDVDVSFITLYERNSLGQQMDLVKREMEDGAEAIVLAPVNSQGAAKALDGMYISCPMVVLGADLAQGQVVGRIAVDSYGMGRELAARAIEGRPPGTPVYLFTEGLDYGDHAQVYEGVLSVLGPAGFSPVLLPGGEPDACRAAIESLVYSGAKPGLFLALDVESLTEAASVMGGSEVYGDYVEGLYGIGSTTWLLNQLDKGVVQGLVATNSYEAGYLSIRTAVEAIGNRTAVWAPEPVLQEFFYITGEDLRKKEYEKILYPID